MPTTAAIYLRSSKDRSDVSIDAQRRALTQLAHDRSLTIIREYADTVESGSDDDRPGFQQLLSALGDRSRGWSTLLLLDTSRLARRRYIAIVFEHEAEKHGVRIVYRSVPDHGDPITAMLSKSILQAIDEYHSMVSRQKGLAGMAENVRQGYRAGGRAPKGYRLLRTATGAVREGRAVTKSKLDPDDNAQQIAAYLRLRARGTPRTRAAHDAGLDLASATLVGIERNALTYAGHTTWNVHDEFTRNGYRNGTKRRPRADWIVQRNTHAALISDDDAESILAALDNSTRRYARVNTPYLLSGLLRAPDGAPWEGSGNGYYRCRKRGGKWVRADLIEAAVMEQITRDTQSESFIARLLAETRKQQPAPHDDAQRVHREIVALNAKIARMMELAGELASPAPALRKIDEYERQRERLIAQQQRLERERDADAALGKITAADVRAILDGMLADDRPDRRRNLLDSLIERIALDPQTLACTLHYRLAGGSRAKLASPRGAENYPVLRASVPIRLR